MDFEILIIITVTSVLQSIFGTGVLLFGTPILLILGKDFQTALTILLPASIFINFFQIRNNLKSINITFYKNLILFCLPMVFLTLYLSFSIHFSTNSVIGIFLIFISLKSLVKPIAMIINWIISFERLYLTIMGILHGFTNLGGSLLSGIILSKELPKDSKRATIAASYCSMACIQIVTIYAVLDFHKIVNTKNFIYWISAPIIFFIIEKYVYHTVDEKLYNKISGVFLFLVGVAVLIKT